MPLDGDGLQPELVEGSAGLLVTVVRGRPNARVELDERRQILRVRHPAPARGGAIAHCDVAQFQTRNPHRRYFGRYERSMYLVTSNFVMKPLAARLSTTGWMFLASTRPLRRTR